MKADLTQQWRLLDLQKLDTRLAQLDHKRRTLPQHGQLEELQRNHRTLEEEVVLARVAVDDVDREVVKAEADVQLVRDRAARDRSRLDSGQGSPKELTSLQHELDTLGRRQSELEDIQLEVMERSEQLRGDLGARESARDAIAAKIAEVQTSLADNVVELDKERSEVASQRESMAPAIEHDLLELYDKLRSQFGVGAAALVQRRCTGCGLELNAGDLGRIKAAPQDEVVRCEECRRILVRTAESGI